jgi:hypothetical protein
MLAGASAPAFAEASVFACQPDRRIEGGTAADLSAADKSSGLGHFLIAYDAAAGKGCLVDEGSATCQAEAWRAAAMGGGVTIRLARGPAESEEVLVISPETGRFRRTGTAEWRGGDRACTAVTGLAIAFPAG